MDNCLEVKYISISFGGLKAVDSFNITIKKGELVGLIGPNGAGKTTVFNIITGIYKQDKGSILINGIDITNKNTHERVNYGIARTFQNIRLFKKMTVLDNVKVAYNYRMSYNLFDSIFRTKRFQKEEEIVEQKALEKLKFLGLDDLKDELASNLPYGKQRKLEIARALITEPSLLCLDEPAAGMNPSETSELMNTIEKIKNELGITILLIEHDMKLVMGICDKIEVLNFGKVIAYGDKETIKNDPEVIKAYLGE